MKARDPHVVASDVVEIAGRLHDVAPSLEGKRILLAGGGGFLGRYFVALFQYLNRTRFRRRCRVVVVDNFITANGTPPAAPGDAEIQLVHCDVIQPFPRDLAGERFDYIIHAAGIASPYYYRKYPLETLEVTTTGTKNLLQLAVEHRSAGFLFFSSSEIYGNPDPQHVPTPESYRGNVSCTGPRACYDEAKRVGETLSCIFHGIHGVPTKIVRPFNVYGPGMRRTDYRVMPNFAAKIVDGQPVTIYNDGRQTRTFCYITDAVVGFVRALVSGVPGEVYNIGNPAPEITMRELVNAFGRVLGRPVEYRLIEYPDSYPADEPMRRCPDISKARLQLQYHPDVTLDDGLERFLRWAMAVYPEKPRQSTARRIRRAKAR